MQRSFMRNTEVFAKSDLNRTLLLLVFGIWGNCDLKVILMYCSLTTLCWHIVAKNYACKGLQFMAGLALPVWSQGRDLMKSSPWSSKLGFG